MMRTLKKDNGVDNKIVGLPDYQCLWENIYHENSVAWRVSHENTDRKNDQDKDAGQESSFEDYSR